MDEKVSLQMKHSEQK
jgi:cell division protein FtsL